MKIFSLFNKTLVVLIQALPHCFPHHVIIVLIYKNLIKIIKGFVTLYQIKASLPQEEHDGH